MIREMIWMIAGGIVGAVLMGLSRRRYFRSKRIVVGPRIGPLPHDDRWLAAGGDSWTDQELDELARVLMAPGCLDEIEPWIRPSHAIREDHDEHERAFV